ncbi:SpoIIE family protein phosphatase [Streptomyces sp. NPDC096057]|uniref:ATP-binding SpoIIE family protein phosphatase n=1 Tax=Streptomyces sp. NPDC096057 TaxID=3155543 RepID=UPI0033239409
MDLTADALLSLAGRALSLQAKPLIHDIEQCLRREVPELWEEPDIARITAEKVAGHLVVVLSEVEHGIDPSQIRLPTATTDGARLLARRGKPVSATLRAFRLAQGLVLDRLLEEIARLTSDAELLNAATRKLISLVTEYVDRSSEQDVLAFQEERDRRVQWRLSVVNEAGMRVGTTLDIARTVEELTDLATEYFADAVTVDLLESVIENSPPSQGAPVARRMAQRSLLKDCPEASPPPEQLHSYPHGSPLALALATGRPSRHLNASHPEGRQVANPARDSATDNFRTRSTLVIPLRARGSTLGVAQFFRYRTLDPYNDEDLLLAQEIAARAAIAIDNARRYTHARATALTLQRSLLPRGTPPLSAVEVACRYLPAGDRLGVGGDWYDVIPLSGARVALVVGDVVGHGIHAAATMGRLRTAVRTLADIDLPPDELLTHLNDVVIRLAAETSAEPGIESSGDIGATCLYAVYDPVAGRCSLARAGHMLPAVVSQDGTVDFLDLPAGPPLGVGGLPFEAVEADLPQGSLLSLYTVGLVEALDHDIEAGFTRLRHALGQSSISLEATCDAILEALLPADRPHDDVALLLARTQTFGDGQVATWDVDADPAAVARTRASVSEQLTVWGLEELDFSAELIVSELVTNAIRYGRPPIRLRLIHDRTLMCEVSDTSSTTPHLRRARTDDEGGRGLLLVAQLAEHWGTRHARRGKTVWAQCTLSPAEGIPGVIGLDLEGTPGLT